MGALSRDDAVARFGVAFELAVLEGQAAVVERVFSADNQHRSMESGFSRKSEGAQLGGLTAASMLPWPEITHHPGALRSGISWMREMHLHMPSRPGSQNIQQTSSKPPPEEHLQAILAAGRRHPPQ